VLIWLASFHALCTFACRDTEGFSCSDLLQLCHEAAMRPVQEVRQQHMPDGYILAWLVIQQPGYRL
jgi:hypothetical protein